MDTPSGDRMQRLSSAFVVGMSHLSNTLYRTSGAHQVGMMLEVKYQKPDKAMASIRRHGGEDDLNEDEVWYSMSHELDCSRGHFLVEEVEKIGPNEPDEKKTNVFLSREGDGSQLFSASAGEERNSFWERRIEFQLVERR